MDETAQNHTIHVCTSGGGGGGQFANEAALGSTCGFTAPSVSDLGGRGRRFTNSGGWTLGLPATMACIRLLRLTPSLEASFLSGVL